MVEAKSRAFAVQIPPHAIRKAATTRNVPKGTPIVYLDMRRDANQRFLRPNVVFNEDMLQPAPPNVMMDNLDDDVEVQHRGPVDYDSLEHPAVAEMEEQYCIDLVDGPYFLRSMMRRLVDAFCSRNSTTYNKSEINK